MIPKSGVRQLHFKNLCKIAAFSNSTKKYDAYKLHWKVPIWYLMPK